MNFVCADLSLKKKATVEKINICGANKTKQKKQKNDANKFWCDCSANIWLQNMFLLHLLVLHSINVMEIL